MPPFRRLAVVLSPAAAVETLLDHAELLERLWAPTSGIFAAEQVPFPPLPPALARARDQGRVTLRHLRDPLLDAVLQEVVAVRADLVLVGAGPAGSDRRALVRRLAMQAPCSVWMAPAGVKASIRRILAPIDFSPRSADALQIGFKVLVAKRRALGL